MDRKLAYITLQKAFREQFTPGRELDTWMQWLDAVYAGDLKRKPPDGRPCTDPRQQRQRPH